MSTLQVNTIETNTPAGVLAVRDVNAALTAIQPSALRSTAANTAPIFQTSTGTPIGTLCRAWVNFNATTGVPIISASFNVSSITDNGVGDYTVNFTTAMPNADYVAMSTAESGGSVSPRTSQSDTQTPNGVRLNARSFQNGVANGFLQDMAFVKVVVFR